ncbi:hypothetical protein ACFY1A_00255 [Streptomyces sp. NPDC001520]|uniref:hypothetical protein n=1 Tax=Streptomyces sp. NPDC001520 TaxID=3364581 RepID=UPI00368FB7B1
MRKRTARIVQWLRRLLRPAGRHRAVDVTAPMECTDTPTMFIPRIPAVPVVDYDPGRPYVVAYERTRAAQR